jgi:hypothetical protein
MQMRITCNCGRVLEVDTSVAGASIACPACGRRLEVPVIQPQQVAPAPPPVVGPPPAPYVPAPQRGKGLGIAALVVGLVSVVPCCSGFGAVLALVAIGLGIAAILRRSSRGMGIAGVVLGCVSILLAALLYGGMFAMTRFLPGGRPFTPLGMMTTGKEPSKELAPPPVLTAGEIAKLLTGRLEQPPDERLAAAELRQALERYRGRQAQPWYLYECVRHFRLHLACARLDKPADPKHAQTFQAASDELVEKVLEAYRQAGEYQQDGDWSKAREKYLELMRLIADSENAVWRNAEAQRDYCRQRKEEKDKRD